MKRARGKQDNAAQGQSMLEAIIALGIISTAIASALTLTTSTIRAVKDSEASITAGNLAREGIEAVRALRDSNWLADQLFDAGLSSGTDYSGIPVFSPSTNSWSVDFAAADAVSDAGTRVYRYSTGNGNATVGLFVQAASQPADTIATTYYRIVVMDPICDGVGGYTIVTNGTDCGGETKIGMRVTSTVQWSVQARQHSISVEERMMDWR